MSALSQTASKCVEYKMPFTQSCGGGMVTLIPPQQPNELWLFTLWQGDRPSVESYVSGQDVHAICQHRHHIACRAHGNEAYLVENILLLFNSWNNEEEREERVREERIQEENGVLYYFVWGNIFHVDVPGGYVADQTNCSTFLQKTLRKKKNQKPMVTSSGVFFCFIKIQRC